MSSKKDENGYEVYDQWMPDAMTTCSVITNGDGYVGIAEGGVNTGATDPYETPEEAALEVQERVDREIASRHE